MIYILDQLYVMKSKVQQLEKGKKEMKLALQHLENGGKEMKTALKSCKRRIQVIETRKFIYTCIQNIIEMSNRIVYASFINYQFSALADFLNCLIHTICYSELYTNVYILIVIDT